MFSKLVGAQSQHRRGGQVLEVCLDGPAPLICPTSTSPDLANWRPNDSGRVLPPCALGSNFGQWLSRVPATLPSAGGQRSAILGLPECEDLLVERMSVAAVLMEGEQAKGGRTNGKSGSIQE